jgi:hypothetical protein
LEAGDKPHKLQHLTHSRLHFISTALGDTIFFSGNDIASLLLCEPDVASDILHDILAASAKTVGL